MNTVCVYMKIIIRLCNQYRTYVSWHSPRALHEFLVEKRLEVLWNTLTGRANMYVKLILHLSFQETYGELKTWVLIALPGCELRWVLEKETLGKIQEYNEPCLNIIL